MKKLVLIIILIIFSIGIITLSIGSFQQLEQSNNRDMQRGVAHESPDFFLTITLFGFISLFSLIFYFATWAVVKKLLHKKYPKLMGTIVISVFIFILVFLYYGLISGFF